MQIEWRPDSYHDQNRRHRIQTSQFASSSNFSQLFTRLAASLADWLAGWLVSTENHFGICGGDFYDFSCKSLCVFSLSTFFRPPFRLCCLFCIYDFRFMVRSMRRWPQKSSLLSSKLIALTNDLTKGRVSKCTIDENNPSRS